MKIKKYCGAILGYPKEYKVGDIVTVVHTDFVKYKIVKIVEEDLILEQVGKKSLFQKVFNFFK